MTKKPNFAKCILGVFVLAILFIGTWASTTTPRSTAQDLAQKQGPTINAPPTPTPTPGAPPAAIAHVFQIDGNVCDEAIKEGTDWNEVNPPTDPACDPGFVTGDPDGTGPIQLATFVIDTCPDDRVFTIGSSKDFNDIQGNWHSTIGSVPDKDEITHAYAAIAIVPTNADTTADGTAGDRVLVFGGDRFATNGDANIGFWFFQNAISVDPVTGDFQGTHVDGDLFIVSAFTGGGGTSTIDVYEWVGTDPSKCTLAPPAGLGGTLDNAGTLCLLPATANKGTGIVNPLDLTGECAVSAGGGFDWPYTTKGDKTPCLAGPCDVPKGAFYEGGVNLSDLGFADTCFSTFLLETRSSQTVDAILKDFALGSFDTCAIDVTKTPDRAEVCEFENGAAPQITYTYTATNQGVSTLNVSLVDDNGTPGTTTPSCDDDIDVKTGAIVGCTPANAATYNLVGGASTGDVTRIVTFDATYLAGRLVTCPVGTTGSCVTNTVTARARLEGNVNGPPDKTATATASVKVNPNPTVSVSAPAVCAGTSSTITATPSPAGTYTYAWTVPAGATDPGDVASFSSGVAGLYSVTVTDGNTCTGSGSATLVVNPNPTVTVNSETICEGSSATITATPSPAGSYTYLWTVPAGVTNPGNVASFSASVAGSYGVTITDGNTCSGSNSGTLTVEANPTVEIAGDEACSADEILALTATVTGGTGTITYTWTVPAGVTDPGNSPTASATKPGNYAVHVTRGVASCPGDAHLHVGLCAGTSTPGPLPTPTP